MKTIRKIQNAMIVIGIITTVALVDQIEVSSSKMWAAFVIASFAVITVIERELRSDNK